MADAAKRLAEGPLLAEGLPLLAAHTCANLSR
jgi:hypothetical protein